MCINGLGIKENVMLICEDADENTIVKYVMQK